MLKSGAEGFPLCCFIFIRGVLNKMAEKDAVRVRTRSFLTTTSDTSTSSPD